MKQERSGSKGECLKVVMVSGKAKLYVTCFGAWSFVNSPKSTGEGKIYFYFFPVFYKMTFDDESDLFHGEVSSLWNYQDETFIFYHSCIPDNLRKENFL